MEETNLQLKPPTIFDYIVGAIMIALLFWMFLGCSKSSDPLPATGCWTGVKNGQRVLIGCYTMQEYVRIETSSIYWSQTYTDMKYESGKTCTYCQSTY